MKKRTKIIIAAALTVCIIIISFFLWYKFDNRRLSNALKVFPGTSYEQVTNLLGTPTGWLTSSYRTAVYEISNNKILVVDYHYDEQLILRVESTRWEDKSRYPMLFEQNIPTVLARYDGIPVNDHRVNAYRIWNIMRGDRSVTSISTDLEIINQLIIFLILEEEAKRCGISTSTDKVSTIMLTAEDDTKIPERMAILEPYLEEAGITSEIYSNCMSGLAYDMVAAELMLRAFAREYCENKGLELTAVDPDELAAAQEAYIKELFEQNKHKITYYIDVPST